MPKTRRECPGTKFCMGSPSVPGMAATLGAPSRCSSAPMPRPSMAARTAAAAAPNCLFGPRSSPCSWRRKSGTGSRRRESTEVAWCSCNALKEPSQKSLGDRAARASVREVLAPIAVQHSQRPARSLRRHTAELPAAKNVAGREPPQSNEGGSSATRVEMA